ncbi:Hsp20/alpha crystallin family protein [Patescibacteria group bacterium]|nr:MAG: Hsp20/alpha crystallin family protein [Patescibacteria group bacterium]
MEHVEDHAYIDALADAVLKPEEGQLSVDVLETPRTLVIRSAIAGLAADELDVNVTEDSVTIRGSRSHGHVDHPEALVHVQECFWGSFSRSVMLPCAVRPDEADASLRNGILTITLPKAEARAHINVVDRNV